MGRELSFEWSHHRISSIVSKVSRVTSQNSIKNRGSERVNIDLETREMSYGTCESAKAIELDRDKRLNGGGGGEGKGGSRKRTTKQNGCRPSPPPNPTRGFDGAWIESSRPCSRSGQSCLHTCLFIHKKPFSRDKPTHTPETELSLVIGHNYGQCYASKHWE